MTNSFFDMVTSTDNSTCFDTQQQNDSKASRVLSQNIDHGSDRQKLNTQKMDENGSFDARSDAQSTAITESDMPADARRALIYLSQQGVILHSAKPQLFDNIVRHQTSIRRHLSEIYCSLIIDEHSGVAFVARADFVAENHEQLTGLDNFENDTEQAELDGEDTTSMIQKRTLNVYDTLLLLNLRKYYQERQNLGETEIIIDIEKLESLMSPFLPLTDHGSKDKKKLSARLEHFAKNHKLVTLKRGNVERYEITPMIRYVVNASLLQAMLNEYIALLGEMPDKYDDKEHNLEQSSNAVTNQVKNDTVVELNLPTKNTAGDTQLFGQQDSLF